MKFKETLKQYQDYVNSVLEQSILVEDSLPETKLYASMQYSLMAGGKRIRPILMLATYQLFQENTKICEPYFIGMEMVHNFSLIHDDLPAIDNDNFRHGKPTNHKVFGENIAILAGDQLLNYAYCIMTEDVMKNSTPAKVRILHEFSKEVSHMIMGETIDVESEGKDISLELLTSMHQNKTGALIKESVRMGAILANATEEQLALLTEFAEKLGLIFQIKDDILSEIGDEKVMGKPAHRDVALNKATFVTKYGLEQATLLLNKTAKQAIDILEQTFREKAEFLIELTKYIRDRNQ